MEYKEAKQKFINSWGTLGSSWGLNKTMAQIHALLMVSPEPLNMEDIMEELAISRGNASMNLKALMEWGIVFKDFKKGDRRDYFYSEKDVWKLAAQISKERRRRELLPVIEMLDEIGAAQLNDDREEHSEFRKMTKELHRFALQADSILTRFSKMESKWFFGLVGRLFK